MSLRLASPGSVLSLEFFLDPKGTPHWTLHDGDDLILNPSPVVLTADFGLLERGFVVEESATGQSRETFAIPAGKASEGRDFYNRLSVHMSHDSGAHLSLEFRLYDDAAAVRWNLETPGEPLRLLAENLAFRFSGDHRCWGMALPNFRTSFEGEYEERTLSSLLPGTRLGLPLLVEAGSRWAAIVEAGVKNHSGMYLTGEPGHPHAVTTQLSPILRGGDGIACVEGGVVHSSPWRVVLVGDSPASLMESTTILALNPPCALDDISWIKPGKVTWDWWCGPVAPGEPFEAGMNNATFEWFVDFAADLGLEYCMIDGGWYGGGPTGGGEDVTKSVPTLDVPRVIEYARAKGVDIILWLHSEDLRPQIDEAFAYYESIGVKGLKIDFFDRNDQDVIEYCHEILEKGARHKLLLNFHGIFCPVGWERTYPHLMTMEGVLGAEYNKWSGRVTPRHNLTLPFTRQITGPMDYTVGVFTHATPETFSARNQAPMSIGTRGQNLAMFVVYQSSLQMVSDVPSAIRGQAGADFVSRVPSVWDETRGLAGAPGEFVVVARRKGRDWHLGAMTAECRMVSVPLSFLSGPAEAKIWQDGSGADKEPSDLQFSTRQVGPGDVLEIPCAPAGGFAAILRLND